MFYIKLQVLSTVIIMYVSLTKPYHKYCACVCVCVCVRVCVCVCVCVWVECGGSQWRAVSSRILSCKLKWSCRESPQEDGSTWMHIIMCYAPTFRSSRHDKDVFYGQLMQAVASVPASSRLLVLGDFNARVGGSLPGCSDLWPDVHGGFGVGVPNAAGLELLNFSQQHSLAICNTHFRKKLIHLATWQHPRSGKWHCIDYIMVR